MTFIDMGDDYGNVQEPQVAPEGDYDLRCTDVDFVDEPAKKKKHVKVTIEIEGGGYQRVFHYLALPAPWDADTDAEKNREAGETRRMKQLMTARFLVLFKIPMDGTKFNPNDIPGSTARCALHQEEYDNRRSNKLTLPPLPDTHK